ncbi:MFS transporter [Iodidimonas sp. SYSU 1G8]|uniref:MFS transporter n=1 Tax=Iodidimonas sp. SYSU 1G8 TaxID=3133967 RepID=UPI0031FF37B1
MTREERRVVLASSLGTVFEWYDFFLYGSLALIIGQQFFSAFPESTRNVFALLAFAAGFLVRPLGALVFGRLGDLAGRKYTFLITIVIMGLSTFAVGLLPNYAAIGWAAPIALISLRILQGLALGGEYGGAVVYVAEHAPADRRGAWTSWIQLTATLGLLLSLVVILGTRIAVGEAEFNDWGWRIPFLVSILLLAVSVYIRMRMEESPVFRKMKAEGKQSGAPLTEAFGRWKYARLGLIALFGLLAGQAVVWYTGQFYSLFFLQSILRVDPSTANIMLACALVLGSGGFILFGSLSDRIGRKSIILAGCLLAGMTFFPLFEGMSRLANPALHKAQQQVQVTMVTNRDTCSFQFNPAGVARFTSPCDIAKAALARGSVAYETVDSKGETGARIVIAGRVVEAYDAAVLSGPALAARAARFETDLSAALAASGYPVAGHDDIVSIRGAGDMLGGRVLGIIGILTVLMLYVTMVYGPIAAALVELFPTRIRYTAMSLPYHIGNGWFGGLLPATSFAMVAQTGDVYFGLWYPVTIALATVVIGLVLMPETKGRDLSAEEED